MLALYKKYMEMKKYQSYLQKSMVDTFCFS